MSRVPHRRTSCRAVSCCLALAAAALLAVMLTPPALAARVHVRVEGKTRTLFGPTEPRLTVTANALDALERASAAGEFYYHVAGTSLGPYVDQIGRFAAGGAAGWVFKVNGASPPVGADQTRLKDGDRLLWYWATFGPASGPQTLRLVRQRSGCYRVLAEDDGGARSPAVGATLTVDGRRVRTRAGRACVGPHRGVVRAVRAGSVRSNALR
ncbi:MAG: DUF4430 domain-containing protein [Actinomycetota bacterium]|nr:DUF4430 domain-containing protein [Actinomycetota bacterium]